MANFPLVRGRAMRATRLNGCGNPVLGPKSVITSEGFVSVALTANNEAGEAISVTNANGKVIVSDSPPPKFVNYSVEVAFAGVNPELVSLMTGQPVVLSADGTTIVGLRVNSRVNVDLTGFALELWSAVPVAQCDASGEATYGYFLLPFLKGGTLGDFTVENGAISFTMTGATTREGSGWGVGPFDVVRDEDGLPGPLNEPITEGDHLNMEITTVPPPSVENDDAQPLGVAATGATAGNPGTYTPANSYGAADIEGMAGITATPSTAWTAGQYVVLQDGSLAHWDGSAWVAGPA